MTHDTGVHGGDAETTRGDAGDAKGVGSVTENENSVTTYEGDNTGVQGILSDASDAGDAEIPTYSNGGSDKEREPESPEVCACETVSQSDEEVI